MGLILPGQTGVDFSYTKPPPARLKQLGYALCVGYESEAPSNPNKNLSNPQDYIAEGVNVAYVWEMNATRTNGGFSTGQHDGAAMKDKMMRHGLPWDCPVMAANDTNTTADNLSVHYQYFRGYTNELLPYLPGLYGDADLLAATMGIWHLGWLPSAWSWSGTSRPAAEARAAALGVHVVQRNGFNIDNRFPVDPNIVLNQFMAWGPTVTPSPIGVEDMLITNAAGTIWQYLNGTKFALPYDDWVAMGEPVAKLVDDSFVNRLPDWAPVTGTPGPQGPPGTPGKDGAPGKDGFTVGSKVTISQQGTII